MISIDYNITSNPYWIRVSDHSSWGLISQEPSIIEVYKPGYETPVTHYYDKDKTNSFNSVNLRVNCTDGDCPEVDNVTLPDGIYKIIVKGSPSKYNRERQYLKTDLLEMDIDKIIITSIENGRYYDIEKQLVEIDMYFAGAHSNLRLDRIREASALYESARKAVDKLLNCKNCYD